MWNRSSLLSTRALFLARFGVVGAIQCKLAQDQIIIIDPHCASRLTETLQYWRPLFKTHDVRHFCTARSVSIIRHHHSLVLRNTFVRLKQEERVGLLLSQVAEVGVRALQCAIALPVVDTCQARDGKHNTQHDAIQCKHTHILLLARDRDTSTSTAQARRTNLLSSLREGKVGIISGDRALGDSLRSGVTLTHRVIHRRLATI